MLRLQSALVRPRLATYYHTSTTRPRLSLPPTSLRLHALSLVCTHPQRRTFTTDTQEAENLNVSHSRFLAEKSRTAKWKEDDEDWGGETDLKESEDFDNLAAGKGMSYCFQSTHALSCVHTVGSSFEPRMDRSWHFVSLNLVEVVYAAAPLHAKLLAHRTVQGGIVLLSSTC